MNSDGTPYYWYYYSRARIGYLVTSGGDCNYVDQGIVVRRTLRRIM